MFSLITAASPALATQYTWSLGLNVAGNWDTSATNWTGASGTPWDSTNGPNNDARFTVGATTTVTDGGVTDTVYTNKITFNTASRILTGGTITLVGTTPTISATGTLNEIFSTLDGSNGLTITPNGTELRIRGNNTYTGGTILNNGVINLGIGLTAPFSTGTVATNSGSRITFPDGSITVPNDFTAGGNTSFYATRANASQIYSGVFTLNGTASGTFGGTLPGNATVFADYNQSSTTFNNPIGGTGDLVFRGGFNETYILKGGASTFSGNTWLWTQDFDNRTGNVKLRLDGGALPSTTVLTMTQNNGSSRSSTLDLFANNQTLAGLTSASIGGGGGGWFVENSVLFGNASTLTINGSGNFTFDGILRNNSSNNTDSVLALRKQGSGIQTLTGLSTYSGGTEISGGGLLANTAVSGTNSATGVGNVSVLLGGTLGGTGQITPTGANGVSVSGGGFIAPGASIGTLTFNLGSTTGKISMLSGAGFQFELGTPNVSIGSIAPGSSDLLTILNAAAGDMDFTGNTIDLLGTATGVGFYKLFDTNLDATTWTGLTTGGAATGGNWITNGLLVSNVGSGLFGNLILADGTSGTSAGDIYLSVTETSSAVPEPSTLAMALLGGGGLCCWVGRRSRR